MANFKGPVKSYDGKYDGVKQKDFRTPTLRLHWVRLLMECALVSHTTVGIEANPRISKIKKESAIPPGTF